LVDILKQSYRRALNDVSKCWHSGSNNFFINKRWWLVIVSSFMFIRPKNEKNFINIRVSTCRKLFCDHRKHKSQKLDDLDNRWKIFARNFDVYFDTTNFISIPDNFSLKVRSKCDLVNKVTHMKIKLFQINLPGTILCSVAILWN
jgi:hypothetical protein